MTRNRVWYVVVLLGCLIFSAAYQSRISAILLVAAAAYPLFALVFTALSVWTVRISFGIGRGVYEKNEHFELPLCVSNNFIFPFAPAELTCNIPDNDTGLFLEKQVFVSVSPFKKMRIFLPCMHKYRGCYPAQITKITVYDPLKIIRISRKSQAQAQLVILPRKLTLEELSGVFGGNRGAIPQPLDIGEKEDFSHVRDYHMGDVMQLIHWKLTAKQQELMIKQYDSEGDRRAVIVSELCQRGASALMQLKQQDAVTEAAIAAAAAAVDAGVRTVADFGSSIFQPCEMKDRAGFRRFYDVASVIAPDDGSAPITDMIERYSAADSSALVIISPAPDEELFTAAERAADRITGEVVLVYVNVGARSDCTELCKDRHFIFIEYNPDIVAGG